MKIKAKLNVHDHIVDESDHRGLSPGMIYYVVGVSGDHLRAINDNGDPVLYPESLFEIVDPNIPNDWITENFDDEDYINPPEFSNPGFYEDYFDGVSAAVDKFEAFRKLNNLPKRKSVTT